MMIFAAVNKFLLDIEVKEIRNFEANLYEFMDIHHPEIGDIIRDTGELTSDTEKKLTAALNEYKELYKNGEYTRD